MGFNGFTKPGFSRIHLDTQTTATNGDWWAQVPAGASMTQAAMAELARMSQSKFARMDALSVGPMEEAAGTKLNRAKRQAAGYQTLGLRI
jgi:hypothetical protein